MIKILFNAFIASILVLVFSSCSPYPLAKKSIVKFQLPNSDKTNSMIRSSLNTSGVNTISSIDEINCYGITVGWNNTAGSCADETSSSVLYANEIFGFYPAGSFVEIEVSAGDNRVFNIIGIASSNGVCPDIVRFPLAAKSLASSPYLVGSKSVNVIEGEMSLIIDVSMMGSTKISHCKNPPFFWEGGAQGVWDVALWDQSTFGP